VSLYTPSKIDRYTLGSATEMNSDRNKVKSAFDAIEALVNSIAEGSGILNYTWIAYADSADGTSNFTTAAQEGRQYMGLAFNRPSATPGSDPSDYNWYLFAPSSNLFQALADGTQAAPGLAFLNDKDTGIRRVGNNAFALVAGGVDRLTIGADGAVSIPDAAVAGQPVPIQGYVGNADLNTVIRSGMYRFNQPVNGPAGVGWSQLLVIHGTSDQVAQIVIEDLTGVLYHRIGNPASLGGTNIWSPWRRGVDSAALSAAVFDVNGATMRRGGQHLYGPDNLLYLSQLANDPGYITGDGRAYPRWSHGGDLNVSGETIGGTPQWLLGSDYGSNTARLYNPANFSVANADTVDGYHAHDLVKYADFTGGNQSLGAAGYQKLPGGLILQWGSLAVGADSYGTLTFPIAFPTACRTILGGVATEVGNGNAQANGPLPYSATQEGASFWNAANAATAWWLALGQ
jgi:hypothetical protein